MEPLTPLLGYMRNGTEASFSTRRNALSDKSGTFREQL
jgi:hypothetical protein